MHMLLSQFDLPILDVDKNVLAKAVWEKLNPEGWPLKLDQLPDGTALVGGAVRDVLLGRLDARQDLDLVVPSQAVKLTRFLASQVDGTCVILDEERDMARLVLKNWTIDLTSQIGNNLEDDLLRRDFKINAIAITLHSHPRIIDPLGGIQDLLAHRLVAVREQNLIDDPLRLLRGLRLAAELNLKIAPQTFEWLKGHAKKLSSVAPERIHGEIQRIVHAPWADEVMPPLKEVCFMNLWDQDQKAQWDQQPPTLKVAKALTISERSFALPLARLTHLLSDEGLKKLRFSRKQCNRCQVLRKWQLRNDGVAFQSLTEVDRLNLHQDLEDDLPALIISLSGIDQMNWLKRWRDLKDPLFHPASPLDGRTLQDNLEISSGPQLGKLMSHLCNERAFGRLLNRDDALTAARYWLKHNNTLL